MKKTTQRLALIALIALALPAGSARAEDPNDLLIIVHNKSAVKETSAAELKGIFLKKRNAWGNGDKASPLNAPAGSALREAFQSRVLEMSPQDEEKHWADEKIRSGVAAPGTVSNPLKAVFSGKSIVSYVFRADLKPGLALVIAVFPKP